MLRLSVGFLAIIAFAAAQRRPAKIFILVGPPGSGKSVQAKLLSRAHKVPAISMESLVKEEMGKKTQTSKALAGSIASGELIGDEAANEIMGHRLLRPDAGQGFVLDGYPNTEKQALVLDAFLKEHEFPKPIVVVLEAPDSVLRERMKARKRVDDTPENIARRLREYRELEKFAPARYGEPNTVRVDGTKSVQAVAAAINQGIEEAPLKRGLGTRPPQ